MTKPVKYEELFQKLSIIIASRMGEDQLLLKMIRAHEEGDELEFLKSVSIILEQTGETNKKIKNLTEKIFSIYNQKKAIPDSLIDALNMERLLSKYT